MEQELNELAELTATQDVGALIEAAGQGKFADDSAMAVVTRAGDFLPFIQLLGSNSMEVKRGDFPMGNFCLKKNRQLIDLGKEVVMYLIAYRPKAMIYKPKAIAYFDPKSPEFKDVIATADQKNSNKGYGPEFLVWLPSTQDFAHYFLGNKTGRNESPNLVGLVKGKIHKCVQKSHLIETPEYSWHGPKTLPYDLDINPMPDPEVLLAELTKFNNPASSQLEPEEKDEKDDRPR